MKTALIYYSFSGNTARAVEYLYDKLLLIQNKVEIIRIRPQVEERNFFKQSWSALLKQRTDLSDDTNYELSDFDYIIFSTAVWAFAITPALRSYLEKADGLKNKKAGCFLTYGSGTGAKKALRELESILIGKGAKVVCSAILQGYKTKDINYLDKQLSSFLAFKI